MIRDWFRTKKTPPGEPLQDCGHCVTAARLLADAVADRERVLGLLEKETRQHATTGHILATLQLEVDGKADIVAEPAARTPRRELLLERARADALEARVHQLQQANMRADCMHEWPVEGRVWAG